MSNFMQIVGRLVNTPLLVQGEYLQVVLNLISQRRIADGYDGIELLDENGDTMRLPVGASKRYSALTSKDDRYVKDGIAIVGVLGSTAHKPGQLSAGMSSSMRTYQGILADTQAAMEDSRVKGVMFHHNSPGGEATGNFSTVRALENFRGVKPMWSLVDELAASASYNLAAATDKIIGPSEMQVGSIGAVTGHTSYQELLEKAGIKVELMASGTEKTLGTPTQDLTNDQRELMQTRINKMGSEFGEFVARNRKLDHGDVMDLQAAVLSGDDALQAGLADEFMSVDDAFSSFAEHLNGASQYPSGNVSMSKENGSVVDDDATETALAKQAKANDAEMQRVKGIYALESANASPVHRQLAQSYVESNMSVEAADASLKLVPVPKEEKLETEVEDTQPDVAGDLLASEKNGTEDLNAGLDKNKVDGEDKVSSTDNIVQMFTENTGTFFGKSEAKKEKV